MGEENTCLEDDKLSLADILEMYDDESKQEIIKKQDQENKINITIKEEEIRMNKDTNDINLNINLEPSLIITTLSGQFDLGTEEGINKVNQEIKDYLTELEHQFNRLQKSWNAKKQIKSTYKSLEEAAKHDASSEEIIKIGERIAKLKEIVKTETPTKEEISKLIMKLEMIKAIVSRYINILILN